jgi:hypothetical protein
MTDAQPDIVRQMFPLLGSRPDHIGRADPNDSEFYGDDCGSASDPANPPRAADDQVRQM